ncbi:MAG: glutaminyl-peptide cyclotransferase [bacterium]|nr:glutaminyl-peptide cyclotransferase [bacterium]
MTLSHTCRTVLAVVVVFTSTCSKEEGAVSAAVPVLGYRLVKQYPRAPESYCQGLLYKDGFLYESTGLYEQSTLRRVRLEDGEVVQHIDLPRELFGEGLVLLGDELIQLTWRSRRALVYDRESFEKLREHKYSGQGWGLTFDGTHLVLSNGKNLLSFLDPQTFKVKRTVGVTADGRPVTWLNELEYVDGKVLANVWKSNRIARIDPATGAVEAWIDLSGLADFPPIDNEDAVLNGIAHDPETGKLWVTGKLWPTLYEIEVDATP